MLFSSPVFFVFFVAYFIGHLLTPSRYRVWLIIGGGAIFYSYWNVAYVGLPFFLTLVAFAGALWTNAAEPGIGRRMRLWLSVVVLLAPLCFFKYTNFLFKSIVAPVFELPAVNILDFGLPLGISFITFTLIAYVVDVAQGRYPIEANIKWVTSYVLFFPHLIAGPILRPYELIPQLRLARPAALRWIVPGITVFSFGLIKKLVFADPIGQMVDAVYGNGTGHSAWDYLLAIYGFAVQIYCDFSGYTDMAIGLALMLGVRLPTNFRQPYIAISIADFWRRWHITLSHWLRDYIYIQLGGSRRGTVAMVRNIMITMALGGLWHGANWTFVIWGIAHGIGVALSHLAGRSRIAIHVPRFVSIIVTFHIVTILWILFRAPDLAVAWRIASGPFVAPSNDISGFVAKHAFEIVMVMVFFGVHRFDDQRRFIIFSRRAAAAVLWPVIALMWMLAITVSTGSSAKFIYFDF
jgi:D-alanyl-lipoteichoic acid acyltransferase DltB (MBOAT superfamily)